MGFLTSFIGRNALIGAVAMLAIVGAYVKGRVDGVALARAETLKATIEAIKEREIINEDVAGSSDAELCVGLGGLWVENACQ